jgi:hypothetical protein
LPKFREETRRLLCCEVVGDKEAFDSVLYLKYVIQAVRDEVTGEWRRLHNKELYHSEIFKGVHRCVIVH